MYLVACITDKVVHERGRRDQTQMACYIYTFLGRGKWWQSRQYWYLVVKQVWWFIPNPILLALARMSSAFCFLFAACFVVEIASTCRWLIITCCFATGISKWQVVAVVTGKIQKKRQSYLPVPLGARRKFVCGSFCPWRYIGQSTTLPKSDPAWFTLPFLCGSLWHNVPWCICA
jgi:hypothetical protein